MDVALQVCRCRISAWQVVTEWDVFFRFSRSSSQLLLIHTKVKCATVGLVKVELCASGGKQTTGNRNHRTRQICVIWDKRKPRARNRDRSFPLFPQANLPP